MQLACCQWQVHSGSWANQGKHPHIPFARCYATWWDGKLTSHLPSLEKETGRPSEWSSRENACPSSSKDRCSLFWHFNHQRLLEILQCISSCVPTRLFGKSSEISDESTWGKQDLSWPCLFLGWRDEVNETQEGGRNQAQFWKPDKVNVHIWA